MSVPKTPLSVHPAGWMCLAAKVKAALLGVCFSGVKDGAADLAFRNPMAQGITRNTASTWKEIDSWVEGSRHVRI